MFHKLSVNGDISVNSVLKQLLNVGGSDALQTQKHADKLTLSMRKETT